VALGGASLVGGMRPGVVAGSAAVVAVPLGAFASTHGTELVPLVVLLAALLEGTAGALGLARAVDLVSAEVLAGFLNALGAALLMSQVSTLSASPYAAGVAGLCVVLTRLLPSKPVPSSLVGLGVASAVGSVLGLDGLAAANPAAFEGGLAALPTPPDLAPLLNADAVAVVAVALPAACGIAFISILETLLAARVVDDNRCEELCTFFYDEDGEIVLEGEGRPLDVPTSSVLALSLGNAVSAATGGFGGCGLVPQTVLNLQSGGAGAASVLAYTLSMALFGLVLAPAVGQISAAALAGVLVCVSIDTIAWRPTLETVRAALEDDDDARRRLFTLALTTVLCYKAGFAVGIVAGVVLDKAPSMRRVN
jgi:SulP family sulfate permease